MSAIQLNLLLVTLAQIGQAVVLWILIHRVYPDLDSCGEILGCWWRRLRDLLRGRHGRR